MSCVCEEILGGTDNCCSPVFGFGGLALLDVSMNAAAGAAAARVGAQLNGAPPTALALKMGALAGTTKAAITTFREVVGLSSVNIAFQILLMLLTLSFGICALLVTEIGNLVLGESALIQSHEMARLHHEFV
jgi:hypothetical protein